MVSKTTCRHQMPNKTRRKKKTRKTLTFLATWPTCFLEYLASEVALLELKKESMLEIEVTLSC